MMIFCSNPKKQYLNQKEAIKQAINKVLEKGQYILGSEVINFEREFAQYLGVKFAVGVGSGTEALHLALVASGIGKGDEVITVSHTAVATAAAIELSGAKPVLIDVNPRYYTMDPKLIKKAISSKTKAILPVHLYGQPARMTPILDTARRYGIYVVEDCCQAHGSVYHGKKVGSLGNIGCFSFYPTKNLGAIGDGGMIVTNNKKLAEKCRLLREYGWAKRYISHLAGWNSRLDELQAAVLRVKLRHLDQDNKRRRELASLYDQYLGETGLVLPAQQKNCYHVYHLYVVCSSARDELRDFLMKKGIQTLIHYPLPIHLQIAYEGRLKIIGSLAESENLARQVLSLPIYPELKKNQLQKIVREIKNFVNAKMKRG